MRAANANPPNSLGPRAAARMRPKSKSRRPACALLAWLLLGLAAPPREAVAQLAGPSQYDIEAVYLYNFAKFVRWPAGSPGPELNICVAGQKIYVDTLTAVVAGERIDTRALSVRAIQRPEEAAGCDILFLDASAKERMDSLLAAVAGKPVLTVSDVPGFLDRGGMIQFVVLDNRVRFSIDLRPAARSGLALSSELLKVAVAVRGQTSGGGAP